MAYATVDDMQKVAEVTDTVRASNLLEAATRRLDIELFRASIEPSEMPDAWNDYLIDVCVNMALRAMDADQMDATQMSMTAGSYSQSWSNADGISGLKPTEDERRMLGINRHRGRIGFAAIGGNDD